MTTIHPGPRHPQRLPPAHHSSALPPRVSLGLPVFNGDNYLAATLDSILAQTFADFELIICDNASTDGTAAICAAYAAQDPRIRYVCNAENLGAARNYNLAFELARGAFFKWVAHDDPLAPECLAACVAALDDSPAAIMSYARTILIDDNGALIEMHDDGFDLRAPQAHRRLRCYFREASAWCHPVFGLIRREVLARSGLIGAYAASDKVLLSELAILGQCHEVPAHLAYRRLHAQISTEVHTTDEAMAAWFDPRARRTLLTPRWRRFLEHLRAVRRAELPAAERLRCYGVVLVHYLSPDRWSGLSREAGQIGRALGRRRGPRT